MNGRSSYLTVGIFITAGVFCLLALSFLFAGGNSSEPFTRYTVFFQRDVSGLTSGAPVTYLGVGIGEVVGIRLVTNGHPRVRVDLKVLQSTPINSATYASLAFQGVTGVAFINLAADEGKQSTTLFAEDNEFPVIPSRDVGLTALLTDGPEITHKITVLLDRANQILDQKNQTALNRTLSNIDEISGSIASQKNTIASLPEQMSRILNQTENAMGQLNSTIDQASPEIMSLITKVNVTTEYLASISSKLEGWVTEHNQDVDKFVGSGLAEFPTLIADTKNTVRSLEKLVSELRKNPSQLIYKPQRDPVVVEP